MHADAEPLAVGARETFADHRGRDIEPVRQESGKAEPTSQDAIAADACRIDWRMFSRKDGLLSRVTLLPLARRVMRKRAAIGMRRLAGALENSNA